MTHTLDIEELIAREVAMSAQLMGNGLTSIRKYNFAQKGYFYTGLFSISNGLERILKLILLFDFKLTHKKYPDNGFLRKKRHEIDRLLIDAREINAIRNFNVNEDIFENEIIKVIIPFITKFAIQSRYYNLDAASGIRQEGNEPLANWDNTVCALFKFPQSRKSTIKKEDQEFEAIPSFVHHTHEDGSHIGDMPSFLLHSRNIEIKQEYSVLHLYKIIRYSVTLFRELDQTSLWHHYLIFLDEKDYLIRKKKVWDSYKQ